MSYNSFSPNLSIKNMSLNKSSNSQPMNRSNVTLWKSKYPQGVGISTEADKNVENDYIENLKKQIYFMEMEMKLMKEREKEIEKTGGFTQLFNDDRDPSQHILQLKQKYSSMRKNLDGKIETLNNKKREIMSQNVSQKAKLDSLKKIEKEIFQKLVNLEEKSNEKLIGLENDYLARNRERLEVEANNRLEDVELKNETSRNQELEYSIKLNKKMDDMDKKEFQSQMNIFENLINNKIKQHQSINEKIKDLESKNIDEPYYKIEIEKNQQYTKKIKNLEKEILEIATHVESLQMVNDHLVQKKEDVLADRKKLAQTNDDLKREIEAKLQLNEIRIQKKVRDNNSEEIAKLENHLKGVSKNISEVEGKILNEIEKIKMFSADILKFNIDLKIKEEKKSAVIDSVDNKFKELSELKDILEDLKREHNLIKEQLRKETADNLLLINRSKVLGEEYASVSAKYNFMVKNYDVDSNLKKISIDDLKNLTQTNSLVNDSILNFANKVGTFKKKNVKNLFE